jgi:hypothetical protein
MEPEQPNNENNGEEVIEDPVDNEIEQGDILEEIILDDNDNIVPDDLDDGDYNPEDAQPASDDDDAIIVEGDEALDAVEENLDVSAAKLTHAGTSKGRMRRFSIHCILFVCLLGSVFVCDVFADDEAKSTQCSSIRSTRTSSHPAQATTPQSMQ